MGSNNKNNQILLFVASLSVLAGSIYLQLQHHDEEALLVDWSYPLPWPILLARLGLAYACRSMADILIPAPLLMLDIGLQPQITMLAHICQKYQIADFLATGPKTIEEIAAYTETANVEVVERLMYAMAANGITKLDPKNSNKQQSSKRFVNTALSATLRRDHPNSVAGWIGHNAEDTLPSLIHLDRLLGPKAVEIPWRLQNPKYKDLWDFYKHNPHRDEQFAKAMRGADSVGGIAMSIDVPFRKYKRVVDVGGSIGHFLHNILAHNVGVEGVLFDRKPVIEQAKILWGKKNSTGGPFADQGHRVEFIEGSFFDSVPVARDGDAYCMRMLLHDWSDDESYHILSNIRRAMNGTNAVLFIGEVALPEKTYIDRMYYPTYQADIQMLHMFGNAKERTPLMWKELLDHSGFDFVRIHRTRSMFHFVQALPRPAI